MPSRRRPSRLEADRTLDYRARKIRTDPSLVPLIRAMRKARHALILHRYLNGSSLVAQVPRRYRPNLTQLEGQYTEAVRRFNEKVEEVRGTQRYPREVGDYVRTSMASPEMVAKEIALRGGVTSHVASRIHLEGPAFQRRVMEHLEKKWQPALAEMVPVRLKKYEGLVKRQAERFARASPKLLAARRRMRGLVAELETELEARRDRLELSGLEPARQSKFLEFQKNVLDWRDRLKKSRELRTAREVETFLTEVNPLLEEEARARTPRSTAGKEWALNPDRMVFRLSAFREKSTRLFNELERWVGEPNKIGSDYKAVNALLENTASKLRRLRHGLYQAQVQVKDPRHSALGFERRRTLEWLESLNTAQEKAVEAKRVRERLEGHVTRLKQLERRDLTRLRNAIDEIFAGATWRGKPLRL